MTNLSLFDCVLVDSIIAEIGGSLFYYSETLENKGEKPKKGVSDLTLPPC